MADPIKPTQADREAAAILGWTLGFLNHVKREAIRDGKLDDHPAVKSLALHAQQAREHALEEAAGVCDDGVDNAGNEGERDMAFAIAVALRALKEPKP